VRRPGRLDPRIGADGGLRGCVHGGSVAGLLCGGGSRYA
jgi:hypothetical protein